MVTVKSDQPEEQDLFFAAMEGPPPVAVMAGGCRS